MLDKHYAIAKFTLHDLHGMSFHKLPIALGVGGKVERGYKQWSDEKTIGCLWYVGDCTTYCGYVGIIQK